MKRPDHYQPFREDLPLGLHTWLYAAGVLLGFVLLSVWLKVGVFWGVFTGGLILLFSHQMWRSTSGARMVKRVFTKSLFGVLLHFLRTRSIEQAAEGLVDPEDDPTLDLMTIVQRQSRWLWLLPMLMYPGTKLLDALTAHSLAYFQIAELYFALTGAVWMVACRRGRLAMLSFGGGDG